MAGARSRLDPRRRRAAAGERAGVPLRPGRRAFLGGALAAGGDILGWSSQGDINAGRGSKSTIVCTPPKRVYDHWGNVTLSSDVPSTGAGIATLAPIAEVPADVRRLAQAVALLPRRHQLVLEALRVDELTRQEVAERHDMSLRNVDTALRQALDHCARHTGHAAQGGAGTPRRSLRLKVRSRTDA